MPQASRPGPRNLLTDVEGFWVGQAEDPQVRTGVTVVLAEHPAVCACDVRGGGPGTRETDLLKSEMLVEAVDAVVLSGGSVYGLGAADGVTSALGASGRGYRLSAAAPPAPIVPAAILFDLANGGDKAWGADPPYARLGAAALGAAGPTFALGSVGAGMGALAGRLKGGVGSASLVDDEGLQVAALAAVNAFGSVVIPGSRAFWAGLFEVGDEFGAEALPPGLRVSPDDWGLAKANPGVRENTTLAVIATNAALSPAEAKRVAIMAQDGLARAIRPVHAPFDGDVVFVMAGGRRDLTGPRALALARLGERAAHCLARAVARGVYAATTWPGGPAAWRDLC